MAKAKFNPGQLKLIEILGNPEKANMTEEEIAKECGVTRGTTYRWKQDPELWDMVYKLAYDNLNKELPKVYAALADKAINGNIKAVELYLKFIGKYIERTESNVKAEVSLTEVTDKELDKALAEYERLNGLSGKEEVNND